MISGSVINHILIIAPRLFTQDRKPDNYRIVIFVANEPADLTIKQGD
jgi:hypothetical protein